MDGSNQAGASAASALESLIPLPCERFLRVALATARALETLHQTTLHGDLRPANILWCEATAGVELIGALHHGSGLPRLSFPAESLPYLAPERTGRMKWSPDARSDLYSLGVTFYQVVAGELPFVGRDAVEWVHCHLARRPQPLGERAPGVPATIAAIVMKLLAKAPEDRYQTVHGLAVDLERCLAQLAATGSFESFALGDHDISPELRLPRRLYARERDLLALAAALPGGPSGAPALVLVTGPAGIGKSALVDACYPVLLDAGGILLAGKPDQLEPGAPYAILRMALAQLCDRLLTEPEDTLATWRARILPVLGMNGRMVIDICPQLELVLGPLPPAESLPAPEARARLAMLFQRLLASVASPRTPLVVFLDDVQWVDAGSLELLSYALGHPESKNLLVIAAYRDDEIAAEHPLAAARAAVEAAGVATIELPVRPLAAEAIASLVGDALHVSASEAAPLAKLVQRKTGGNPLFVNEVLTVLHRDGAIFFDPAAARWSWDLRAVEAAVLADNVADLVIERLDRLPEHTIGALALAACLGAELGGRMLEQVIDGPVHELLAPAVEAGLVHRLGDAYAFAHDQVQQAAYALTPSADVAAVHARIGRRLLTTSSGPTLDEHLFLIANQLRRGSSAVTSDEEAEQWAEIELRAGIKAKAASAFQVAAGYLAAGAALLGDGGWTDHYELTHALVAERSQAEHLAGKVDEAERLCELLLARSRTALDKQIAYRRRIEVLLGRSNAAKAVEVCLEGLASVGMPIPSAPDAADVDAEIAAIELAIGGHRIEELADLPAMQVPEMRAAIELLSVASPAAWYFNETLSQLMLGRMVRLSIVHGNVDASAMGYVSFGMVLIVRRGDFRRAYELGRLGCELARRGGGAYWAGMVENIFAAMVAVWTRPLRECIDPVRRSLVTTTQSGNVPFVAYNCTQLVMASLAVGEPIDGVYREGEQLLQTARSLRSDPTIASIESALAFMRAMRGLTEGLTEFSGPDFDERSFAIRIAEGDVPLAVFYHHLLKLKAAVLAGDVAGSLLAAAVAMPLVAAIGTQFPAAECRFYSALAHLAACEGAEHEARPRHLERAHECAAPITAWAEACPANFLAMERLVGAELARVSGAELEAMKLYDQAVAAARDHDLPHLEGLANELGARFHLGLGLATTAAAYLRQARAAYARWGARGKVGQVERRYAGLLGEARGLPAGPTAQLGQLDVVTVVKAAQVISSEIVLDRLAAALLRLAVEHAGAELGMFFAADDHVLSLAATASASSYGVGVEVDADANRSRAVPWSVVHYVQRTKQSLVLDDPAGTAAFGSDEVLARDRPRSVLCMPLLRRSGLVGLLYLQNGLVRGAFTPPKRALLEVLAAQAIIALENAHLYAELVRENRQRAEAEEALHSLNAELETRVADRTAELRHVNQELEAFSYAVSHDLKAPLRLLEWSTAELERNHGVELNPAAATLLAQVQKGGLRMRRLIDDMLGLWSVTRTDLRHEDVDLGHMAREILADLTRTHPGREVDIVVTDRARAAGDPRMLRIALENLLHNAWKFTEKQPRARIELGIVEPHGHRPTLFVRDDGAGFAMEDAGKLFTPFQRLHDAEEFPGTGIGLATVRRIVRLHGGRVWAESAVGGGATFFFTL